MDLVLSIILKNCKNWVKIKLLEMVYRNSYKNSILSLLKVICNFNKNLFRRNLFIDLKKMLLFLSLDLWLFYLLLDKLVEEKIVLFYNIFHL